MTEYTVKAASEGGHWYTRGAELIDQVEGKTTGRMRRPTVKDARANQWLPGVTTIIKQAAAPWLMRWTNKEHVRAAVQLGPPADEDADLYFRRVTELAGAIGRDAADVGSRIHGEIQAYITQRIITATAAGIMQTVADAVRLLWEKPRNEFPKLDFDWRSEDPVKHWLGYATKADCWSPAQSGVLVDFKGKKSAAQFPTSLYDEHLMQLAATRSAIEHTHGKTVGDCAIVFFSRQPEEAGQCAVVWASDDQISRGRKLFDAMLTYWKVKNSYDSSWDPEQG